MMQNVRTCVIALSCFLAGTMPQAASAAFQIKHFPPCPEGVVDKRRVNAAPSYPPAFTFVIRDNIAFATPSTACACSTLLAFVGETLSSRRPGASKIATNWQGKRMRPANSRGAPSPSRRTTHRLIYGRHSAISAASAEHNELIRVITGHEHDLACEHEKFSSSNIHRGGNRRPRACTSLRAAPRRR